MDTPQVQILALVGLSLSAWSQVERAMTDLFIVTSEMERRRAMAAFDGIISFEVRLSILDRMMAFQGLDELEAETWIRMSRRLSKFYKKRHELAHFALGARPPGEFVINPFLTYEKLWESVGKDAAPLKALNIEAVSARKDEFIELALTLDWFTGQAVRRHPELGIGLTRPLSEPLLVARLQASAAQILEERKQRGKPGRGTPEED